MVFGNRLTTTNWHLLWKMQVDCRHVTVSEIEWWTIADWIWAVHAHMTRIIIIVTAVLLLRSVILIGAWPTMFQLAADLASFTGLPWREGLLLTACACATLLDICSCKMSYNILNLSRKYPDKVLKVIHRAISRDRAVQLCTASYFLSDRVSIAVV